MPTDLLLAFLGFTFVSSITPGPNNLMLMASGANYGWLRTVPHMLGVGLGFTVMVFLVGIGVIGIFEAFPMAYTVLRILATLYLLYLAWRIATAAPPGSPDPSGRPFTFLQAAAFQWVNPKAWTMALTANTAYAPDQSLASAALVAAIFGIVNIPTINLWVLMGRELRRFLASPGRLRAFNITMAVILVASLIPVLMTMGSPNP